MDNIKPLDGKGVSFLWTQILLNFVKKEEGKGLSANDLTNELLQKIQSAGTSNFDGDYNSLIGRPQINGIALAGNRSLDELGITKAINDAIGNVTQIQFEVVENYSDLPVIGIVGTFYLVPNKARENNNYNEYIWDINNFRYELIGTIQSDIDLNNYYTKTQVDDLVNKIPSSQRDCAPVGTIISFMGVNAPTGYLKCDGATYNISQYQELANHFKSNFGSYNYFGGNGTNTFGVPDLRGEFLRGVGTATRNTGSGAGVAGGHQDPSKMQSIYLWDTNGAIQLHAGCTSNVNNTLTEDNKNLDKQYIESPGKSLVQKFATNTTTTSKTTRISLRPTNTSVLYCIKHKKIVEL